MEITTEPCEGPVNQNQRQPAGDKVPVSNSLPPRHGDIKSQPLSSDPEMKTSGVGRIQLSKHQSCYLSFTMLPMKIKNVLTLLVSICVPGDQMKTIFKCQWGTAGSTRQGAPPQRRLESERHWVFFPWGNKEGRCANPTDFRRVLIYYWPLTTLCCGLSFSGECLAVKVKHAKKHEMIFKKDCISSPEKTLSNSPRKGVFQVPLTPRVFSPSSQMHLSLQNPRCWAVFICHLWGKMGWMIKREMCTCLFLSYFFSL